MYGKHYPFPKFPAIFFLFPVENMLLNALKKMDKSITLQELNEKLTKQVAEPDLPEPPEDDIDV